MNVERVYTADSFETVFSWSCKLVDKTIDPKYPTGKKIAKYVEWNDKDPPIPKWCPRAKANAPKRVAKSKKLSRYDIANASVEKKIDALERIL